MKIQTIYVNVIIICIWHAFNIFWIKIWGCLVKFSNFGYIYSFRAFLAGNLKLIAEYFQRSEAFGGPTRDWIGIYDECSTYVVAFFLHYISVSSFLFVYFILMFHAIVRRALSAYVHIYKYISMLLWPVIFCYWGWGFTSIMLMGKTYASVFKVE